MRIVELLDVTCRGVESDVVLSMSEESLQSMMNLLLIRKSSPSMGEETSAITNCTGYDRLRCLPKLTLALILPYTEILVPFALSSCTEVAS